jgi:hypothetical protein
MTVLPLNRIQCDRCLAVHVLSAPHSKHWGDELYSLGWRARPINNRYRHACQDCAEQLLAEFEGKPGASKHARAAQ